MLAACRVAECFGKVGQHRFHHPLVDGCCRMIVHVHREIHHTISIIVSSLKTRLIVPWSFTSGFLIVHVPWMIQFSGLSASHCIIVTADFPSITLIMSDTLSSL